MRALGPTLLLALSLPAFAGVTASSEATRPDGTRHPAALAVDGLLSTGWAEGDSGAGAGAWIEVRLDRPTEVSSVSIWPGNIALGSRGLREHGRPHTVTVTLKGGPDEVHRQVRVLDIAETGPVRLDVPIQGRATAVRVTLDEVTAGGIYDDTFITEIAVNYLGGDSSPTLGKLGAWMASATGQQGAAAHLAEVEQARATIAEADFGDREQFAVLREATTDGPAYLRERVARSVADGFRAQALAPSHAALNALLSLEDPNAIAPLELAATRATGELQATLTDRVQRLRALQTLKGGGNRNVPAFGEPGFCPGCLQSLGEPMGLAVDNYGGVWVADFGNHRVQRFDFQGLARKQIGVGEPSISDAWLDGPRAWYAAAHVAGSQPGAFTLPLGVAILPTKGGDRAVVLDAAARVSRIDATGQVDKVWSLGVTGDLGVGLGGEAHITVAGKQVVASWGDQAFVFSADGEPVGRFTFQDGVANGLVGFKNGKIGALFHDTLVLYSPDGFRHASLLGDTVPPGFEFWTAATDEKGKLWVVTDHGWAVKYKKPGRVDYQVRLVDYTFGPPRADVYQDVVFVSDPERSRFQRFDALDLAARAAADGPR